MSLVSLADYKSYLKINNTAIDADLTIFQSAVEAKVANYLRRIISVANYTEYLDGNDTNTIVLNQYPIQSVTTVSYWDDEWIALTADDYDRAVINDYEYYLENYTFVEGYKNYKVEYSAGYSTIPSDIQLACKKLMKLYYDESAFGDGWLGKVNTSNGAGVTQNLSIDLDAEDRILSSIAHYKAYNV